MGEPAKKLTRTPEQEALSKERDGWPPLAPGETPLDGLIFTVPARGLTRLIPGQAENFDFGVSGRVARVTMRPSGVVAVDIVTSAATDPRRYRTLVFFANGMYGAESEKRAAND